MSDQTIYQYLKNLKGEPTAHLSGFKKVFLKKGQTECSLAQFAFGVLKKGQESGPHTHPSMSEFFYFLSGKGLFKVGNEKIPVRKETFVHVPSKSNHNLINEGDSDLKFIYFGIENH